jgi:hypothetical protein
MTYNDFTQTELGYEFLYNLRDQTILFSKLADGKHEKDLLEWLDGRILSLEEELEKS